MSDPDTAFDGAESRPGRARRRGWLALVTLALIVGLAAVAGHGWRSRSASESATIAALRAELDALRAAQRTAESARAALERRVGAAEGVNRSLREEVLGLGERARVLEEAVARLAQRGLHGSTQLRLYEAEFLLSMGEERLALFGDVAGTLRAFDLADAELAALDDPVFAGVRQTLAGERAALRALPPFEPRAVLAELDAIADAIAALPTSPTLARAPTEPAPAEAGVAARLGAGLRRFVRVERIGEATAPVFSDPEAQRRAAQVEILRAKSAVALGDREAMRAAIERARITLGPGRGRDAEHDAVLERLDRMAAVPAFEPPPVGAALAQLRNLRATRALATPPPPSPEDP